MSRKGSYNNDGCTIIAIILFSLFYAIGNLFKGEFVPAFIIFSIYLIIYLYFKYKDIFESKKINIENKKIEKYYKENIEKKDDKSIFYFVFFIIVIIAIIGYLIKSNNSSQIDTDYNYIQIDSTSSIINDTIREIKIVKDTTWSKERINNCEFDLPLYFEKDYSNSNEKMSLFICDSLSISISIASDEFDENNLNVNIDTLANNISEYAYNFNANNKSNFDDFELINYNISKLGNAKSIKIFQKSKKISGLKDIYLYVVSFTVIEKPYYYDVTYSYPINNLAAKKIFKKIEKGFKFN